MQEAQNWGRTHRNCQIMKKNINIKSKYLIKIPENIKIVFCTKTNLIIFKGPLKTKVLIPEVKIFQIQDFIWISKIPTGAISNNILKNLNKLQGTIAAQIKLILIEVTNMLYKKLVLIGVGYRAFVTENLINQITLKLGYSHLIFYKIPKGVNTFCLKHTKLFVFGLISYAKLTQITASIRQCKKPEPYKGKGILFSQENIKLKKGKKI